MKRGVNQRAERRRGERKGDKIEWKTKTKGAGWGGNEEKRTGELTRRGKKEGLKWILRREQR